MSFSSRGRAIASLLNENNEIKEALQPDQVETTVYATVDDLPVSGNDAGDQAYVSNTNRLYLWSGAGWYTIALINQTPYWVTEPDSDYVFDKGDNNLDSEIVIVIEAADSDGTTILTYTTTTDSDFNQFATVTKDSDNGRTFTVSLKDVFDSEDGQTGQVVFSVTDGINILNKTSTVTYIVERSVQDLVDAGEPAGIYSISMGGVTKSVYFDGSHALYASFGTGGSLSPASTYPAWKQSLIKNSYIITNAASNGFSLSGVDHYHDGTTSGAFGSYVPKDGYFAFFNGSSDTATIDWSPDTDANNIDISGVSEIKVVAGPGATTLNASGGYVQIQGSLGTPSSMESAETTMTYSYSDSYSGSAPFFRIHEANGISGVHAIWFK